MSWNATAGQARGEFTKGTGVVAVGDSDEYDDKADAKFNASIATPAISIAGIDPEFAHSQVRLELAEGTAERHGERCV